MREIFGRLTIPLAVGMLVAAGAVLAGCGSDGGSDSTAASDEPVQIGFAIGRSGFLEVADGPAEFAAREAIKEINAAGGVDGRELTASFADVKSDPATGANAAIELLDGGAEVLVTACGFDFGGGTAAIEANDRGVLSISTCGGGSKYGPLGAGELVFTTATSSFGEGAAMAEFAADELGLKSAFVVAEEEVDFDTEAAWAFEERFKELGGQVAGSTGIHNEDQSFDTQISEVEQSGADSVYLATYMPGAAKFMREARSAGLDVTFLGTEDFDGEEWKEAVPNLSDVYYTAPASLYGDDPNEAFNELLETYEAEKGEAPPLSLGLISGYTVVEMIARAIEQAGGTTEGAALAEVMTGWEDEEFMIGPTTYDPATHLIESRDERVMKIEDGVTSLVDTVRPTQVPTQ